MRRDEGVAGGEYGEEFGGLMGDFIQIPLLFLEKPHL